MSLNLQIAQVSEIEEILEFENRKLKEQVPDETERTIQSWNSKWRKEALEHYFASGWSFSARDEENNLIGYFMAQPLLFFDGQTQALWVDHLQYSTLQARDELCELAFKLSKEKHFQRVYFPNNVGLAQTLKLMKAEEWSANTVMIKTTKSHSP